MTMPSEVSFWPFDPHVLTLRPEMATNLDGRKFRSLTGFKLLYPKVEIKSLEAVVTQFQEQGIW